MFSAHFCPAPDALLLLSAATFAALPAHAQWHALHALEQRGALVSAAAIDLDGDNTVIEELDATQRLTPASLTKLATAAWRCRPGRLTRCSIRICSPTPPSSAAG